MAVARTLSTGFVWAAVAGVSYFAPPDTFAVAVCALIATMFVWRSA